ncbi:MAG: helix-hairpin-helix domain-containing protein [Pseudomonadota bacterium]|nr:helix-hairpin-helix domain-containing protein [Pseudomonadota bacterium]
MNKKRSMYVVLFFTFLMMITFTSASALLAADSASGKASKININTATAEQLTELKRIGPVYAKRIIEYRKAKGPFEKPEDIIKVKGIGPKTLEANIDIITVE